MTQPPVFKRAPRPEGKGNDASATGTQRLRPGWVGLGGADRGVFANASGWLDAGAGELRLTVGPGQTMGAGWNATFEVTLANADTANPSPAALTLRGRVTWKNRAPFETQFVCLLDGERPAEGSSGARLPTRGILPFRLRDGPSPRCLIAVALMP